ncbi:MAG TPA: DUF58 domain-containing protein [Myxococcota bacterium]|nr:DUF58 domain-containing protein [Myxococcota bacterium]
MKWLWEPEVLARIRHLQLVASNVVDGLLHGDHRSRRVGSSIEFADYKEYAAGDNLRDLDWRVMARTDRLVIKRYQVETELACTVVLDASADLGTAEKFEYAVKICACLLWFLHRHQEPVGLVAMGDGLTHIPPRTGKAHLARIFGVLASLAPYGTADLRGALAKVAPGVRRRSLVAIVSDFAEEPSDWAPSLDALARRRTDVRAFHVLDPRELRLDWENPALFWGPESPDELLDLDPVGVRPEFEKVRDDWLLEVMQALHARSGRYYAARTDQPLSPLLSRFIGGLS